MKRSIMILALLLIPAFLMSQEEKKQPVKGDVITAIPVLSKFSNTFEIKNIDFNTRIDLGGKGEILECQFILENLTDDPMELYIFTIATFEKREPIKTSFESFMTEKERIRSFVAYPDDLSNFQYPDLDAKGIIKKDEKGKDRIKLEKFPKNAKLGINPSTGKAYQLKDKLIVRTYHLSKYRKEFYFFNNLVILIFDAEGKPLFRQYYELKGRRR